MAGNAYHALAKLSAGTVLREAKWVKFLPNICMHREQPGASRKPVFDSGNLDDWRTTCITPVTRSYQSFANHMSRRHGLMLSDTQRCARSADTLEAHRRHLILLLFWIVEVTLTKKFLQFVVLHVHH